MKTYRYLTYTLIVIILLVCNKDEYKPESTAVFSYTPAVPKVGQKVQFTAQAKNATSYEWSSTPTSIISKEANPGYTFEKEGTYQIKLKITLAKGADSISKSITVIK